MKLLVLALVVMACQGRELKRCELVWELRVQGFPEAKLRDWVCLVENESHSRTHQVGRINKNGSSDYGLFQINDKYWCSNTSTRGKGCNVTCAEVSAEDITKASKCAKKIFKRHGFKAWYGWRTNCQNKPLPDISGC